MFPLHLALLLLAAGPGPAQSQDLGSVTDYAPQTNVRCPNVTETPLLRVFPASNQTINALEESYVKTRQSTVIKDAWASWLGDGSDIGYNFSEFASNLPTVGVSFSGGGYRAAQYGAGVLSALDARNSTSVAAGTGGLLQVATYLSGLSGSSWLTASLYFNNFPTIWDMVLGDGGSQPGWILDLDLAIPGGDDVFDSQNQEFFGSILWSVEAKADTGIYTSLTDPWARMISFHFLNGTNRTNFFTNDTAHGAGQLWSHMPDIPAFQEYSLPFPVIIADSRPIGTNSTAALTPDAVVYEITPFEFGSWDPNLSAMANMTYIGTSLNNGNPPNSTGCVTGFDQVGFMIGTSASLFNQILDHETNTLTGFAPDDATGLADVLRQQLQDVRMRADDVANWPNPFQNINPNTFEDSNSTWLDLIDGSSNLEGIPMGNLLVKARALDVLVAADASADIPVMDWPNGTSLLFTQARLSTILNTTHQQFPPIPANQTQVIDFGLNLRPTFFGCDPTQNPPEYPLVIYLPNSPPNNGDNPVTNTDTFKIQYTPLHTALFLDQVYNNTMGGFVPNNTGSDPNFGKCLQCAVIDRARYTPQAIANRSEFCTTCFKQYCFDPSNPPGESEVVGRQLNFVDPDPQGLSKVEDFLKDNETPLIIGAVFLVVAIVAVIFALRWWKKRKDARYEKLALADEEMKIWNDKLMPTDMHDPFDSSTLKPPMPAS